MLLALFATLAAYVAGPVRAEPDQLRVDKLFAQMQVARTEVEAGAIQSEIRAIWKVSGSDTADLLMVRVEALNTEGDLASAMILVDSVVELYPDFAEGWFKRAHLRILRDEAPEASSDLIRALQVEPRHFGALEMLGGLYEAQQEPTKALETYRQFLALNPHSDSIRQKVAALERKATGQAAPLSVLPDAPAPAGPGSETPARPLPPLVPSPVPAAPENSPSTPPI